MIIRYIKVENGIEKAMITFVKLAADAKKEVFCVKNPVFDTGKQEIESLKSVIDEKIYE